jgi:hypothetical protein
MIVVTIRILNVFCNSAISLPIGCWPLNRSTISFRESRFKLRSTDSSLTDDNHLAGGSTIINFLTVADESAPS